MRALVLFVLALAAAVSFGGCAPPSGSSDTQDARSGGDPSHDTPEAAVEPDPEDPSILRRPFTADQIRDGMPAGLTIDFLRRTPGNETRERWRVLDANAEGAEIEYSTLDADGNPQGETRAARSDWIELRNHASFPTEASEGVATTRETALGMLTGWLYTVRDEDSGTVTELFFARSLPGAPVEVRVTKDGDETLALSQTRRNL